MNAPPVVALLQAAYAAARRRLVTYAVTSRRWRRPEQRCPAWCAGDHTCTARHGNPSGEHRSRITILSTWYGTLNGARVQDVNGRSRMELWMRVSLDPRDEVARQQAGYLPVAIDLAVSTVLAQLVPAEPPAMPPPAPALPAAPPAQASPWAAPPTRRHVLSGEIVERLPRAS